MADANLTGAQKAAMLVMTLDEEQAALLLRNLSEESIAKLRKAAEGLDVTTISDTDKREALRGFYLGGRQGGLSLGRPAERFRRMLAKACGAETVERIYTERPLAGEYDEERSPEEMTALEAVECAAEEQIAMLLEGESPRSAAVLLSQLGGHKAGRIVNLIEDEEIREAVVERMICTVPPMPEVVGHVLKAFRTKLEALGPESERASEEKRARDLADMITSLDKSSQERVLSLLAENDPELTETVEQLMFSFPDLTKVGSRSMQELLRRVEVPLIAMALKGAPEDIASHFSDNLSARARERVREEREMAGRVPMSQVEQAREEIMRIARRMYREGEIVVETGEEQYVE